MVDQKCFSPKKFGAVLAFLFVSCGDDPHTWEDAIRPVAEAYCELGHQCFGDNIEKCVEFNMFQLCELDDICDVEVKEVDSSQCEAELSSGTTCFYVYYGILPESCGPVLELWPDA